MPPKKKTKDVKSADNSGFDVNDAASVDMYDRPRKPIQPTISGEVFLAHPAVSILVDKPLTEWTRSDKNNLAEFLSNRSGIDMRGSSSFVRDSLMTKLQPKIDELTWTDKEVCPIFSL